MRILPGQVLDARGRAVPDVQIQLREERQGEDALWRAELVNGGLDVEVSFARPLVLEVPTNEPPERIRFLVNGYSSFSGSGSFHLGETEIDSRVPWLRQVHRNFHVPRSKRPGALTSSMFGVLGVPGEEAIAVGFVELGDRYTQVQTEMGKGVVRVWAQLQLERQVLRAGARMELPAVFVGRGPAWRAMERYTRRLAEACKVKLRPAPPGWCTWYHYLTRIDERECHKNLELAKELRPPIRVFQLDDGYQRAVGDWLVTNEKFPSGLEGLARRVREAGFTPGLWVAPFFARLESELARRHPDWLLRDGRGRRVVGMWNPNWGPLSFVYALDATRPELLEHVRQVFGTLREWGFGFFKLDFLYAASLPGVYRDATQTSLMALRRGLQVIREAVGDAYLLGCGCPLEVGIGVVDSMRVGNDVTPYWSNFVDRWIGRGFEQLSTRNCIRNTLVRAPMNDRLFHSDPDCLLTAAAGLTAVEKRTLAQVNALSGGAMMISDDLAKLDDGARRLIEEAFRLSEEVRSAPRTYAAPDVLERRIPELQLALGPNDALLGVYNFEDQPAAKTVRIADLVPWERVAVEDRESGRAAELDGGELRAGVIEPHGSRLFRIARAD